MQYYVKLHTLAIRRDVAAAAALCASEKFETYADATQELLQNRARPIIESPVDPAILQAIAVRDAADGERRRTGLDLMGADAEFEKLLEYLEAHPELIPEGIPSSLIPVQDIEVAP